MFRIRSGLDGWVSFQVGVYKGHSFDIEFQDTKFEFWLVFFQSKLRVDLSKVALNMIIVAEAGTKFVKDELRPKKGYKALCQRTEPLLH